MTLSTKALADVVDLLEPDAEPIRTKEETTEGKAGDDEVVVGFAWIFTRPLMEWFVDFAGFESAVMQHPCDSLEDHPKGDFLWRPKTRKKNAEAKSRMTPTTMRTIT